MDDLADAKKHWEEIIVETILNAVEKERIKEKDTQPIAQYVLDRIDKVKSDDELTAFIHELSEKWEIFKPVTIMKDSELQERVEDEVAQGVLVLIEHGKIDNAIKLAQSVTHKPEEKKEQK